MELPMLMAGEKGSHNRARKYVQDNKNKGAPNNSRCNKKHTGGNQRTNFIM